MTNRQAISKHKGFCHSKNSLKQQLQDDTKKGEGKVQSYRFGSVILFVGWFHSDPVGGILCCHSDYV